MLQYALDLFDPPTRLEAGPLPGHGTSDQTGQPPLPPRVVVRVAEPAPRLDSHHPQANRRTSLGGVQIAYLFKRGRRRTIGFSVDHEGLVVMAPRWVTLGDVQSALDEKAQWIVRKLVQTRERHARMVANRIEWKDGGLLPFLGEPLEIVLDPHHAFESVGAILVPRPAGRAVGDPPHALRVGLARNATADQIRDAVQAWLMRQARRVFTERLDHFAPRLQVQWRRLSLSNAGTRWGSARSDGAIRLHWRLIHFRADVIDYVVAHELSHLRVMDHSPRFWDAVRSVVPDYRDLRAELRQESIPSWS